MNRMRLIALLTLLLATAVTTTAHAADPGKPKSIIGGYYPAASQWPWATLLVYSDRYYQGNDFDRKFCTATLISPTRVLTAGHCVAEDETGSKLVDPSKIQALVGRRRASDPSTGERINVSAIAIHPKYYAPESGVYKNQAYYDVAVLFLEHPTSIQPATIGAPTDFGQKATTMGWGHTNHEADITSDDLKAADLFLWSDSQCSAAVDSATTKFYFPSIHICAGGDGVNGVCHGDSGGGLMVTSDRGQTWRLIGVTSFYPPGAHCSSAGVPTGFAWVAGPTLRDWPLTVAQPAAPVVTVTPTPTPTPDPVVSAEDTTAPTAKLSETRARTSVAVTVGCPDEACAATVSGKIRVRGKTYVLRAAKDSLTRGAATRFSWRLPKAWRTQILRALRARKGVAAKLRVTVMDAAGNRRTVTRSIAFR